MEQRFAELKTRLAEIHDLRRTQEILFWDQTVMMPPGGAAVRAHQVSTLDRIAHEKFVSDTTGTLLDELADYEQQLDYDSDDASLIRTARRDWEKARRVPAELAAEMTRAAVEGHDVWAKARAENDYELFRPVLERDVDLKRRYVECFEGYDEPYDALLDDFEPGMKTAEVRQVFEDLKTELIPLIAEIGSVDGDDAFMDGPWPIDAQHAYSLKIIERFGYDPSFARLDLTVHPFAASSGTQDIRLTTRYKEDDITSIFTAMHECGHGLYEHGVSPSLERTPLCHGVSLGAARVAEPAVGEHRRPQPPLLEPLLSLVPGGVPRSRRRRRPGALLPRDQPRQAVVHPGRRRRGDVQPAHHPPLRAGAGDPVRRDRPEGAAGDLERPLRGVPRHPGAERHARRAPGRALVGRQLRLLPHLLAREHRLGADLGEGAQPSSPTCTTSSSRASSGSCTTGCGATSTCSAASSRRRRRWSASSAARSTRPRTCAT